MARPDYNRFGQPPTFRVGLGKIADEVKGRRGAAYECALVKIDEKGATLRSYLDGSVQTLAAKLT